MVEDHAMVRRGLRAILEEEIDDIAVDEAGTAREGMDALRHRLPDAVILDIGLPDRNGLDLLKRIHQLWPKLPALVLSMYSEEQYGIRVMRAGAAGYLTKGSAPENLGIALRRIRLGHRYISASLAEKLASRVAGDQEQEPDKKLSDREYEIFRLIASGKTVSEIAAELCLSVKTVSTYRTRLLEKTGMKNNAEITRYAISKALVD
jgi:DNA-binding NarL/FixJ family response regulator